MDMSSSATQRNSASDALSIQPGSVRVTTASAANEFARHLAENTRSDAGRRRDDRPAERTERSPDRTREARKDRDENRKAENDRPAQENAENQDSAGAPLEVVATPAIEPEMTVGLETSAHTADEPSLKLAEKQSPGSNLDEEVPAQAAEAPAGNVAAAPATALPEEVAAPAGEAGESDTTLDKPAKPAASQPEHPGQKHAASKPGETNNAPAETAETPARALPEKRAAEQRAASDSGVAGDDASETTLAQAKSAEDAKPAKGLGQEAAEKLAGKKAEAKQDGELPKAALQTVQQVAQQILRAAAMPAQRTPLIGVPAVEGGAAMRGGDLPPGTLPQSSPAGATAATVRIGTLPGQSQPTQVPAAAIALQMARNLQKGLNRFDIRLDPPEMGRIDVRMEIRKDGQVVAHMSVERPETLDLLQRDARALQQALNNAGLQADSDSLNFSLKDGSGDGAESAFAGADGSNGNDEGEDDTSALPIYNINLAADGGVDIRV